MRIGTDVSIQTCRDEGYMVMDYKVKEFKKDPFTTDCRFTKSIPDYIREDTGWTPGTSMLDIDMYLNWNDLWEIYMDNKSGIDLFIGGRYDDIKIPEPHDVLNLASDIDMYCGLV